MGGAWVAMLRWALSTPAVASYSLLSTTTASSPREKYTPFPFFFLILSVCLSLELTLAHSSSRPGLLLACIHFKSRSLPIASTNSLLSCLSSLGLVVHCIICQCLPSPRVNSKPLPLCTRSSLYRANAGGALSFIEKSGRGT